MRDPRHPFAPEDLATVETVFADLVAADPSTRASLLAERCAGRPDLQAEIEALLAAHDRTSGFLDVSETARNGREGAIVGQYRLLEKVGEGGMGEVYAAARADGLYTHRVAIKLTRTSVSNTESLRRFRAERQILASLNHPDIVTLLDGGTTTDGQAYLVMEWVDGVPIGQYCRERKLTLNARLTLFCRVCRAVEHAHRHGIVHRDLKPANILVTPEGAPKVLDFGVAKLLEPTDPGESTRTGLFPGPLTPNYASPEQLRGLPVTTACDVYALGVLLYELATGVRPYETSGKTLDQLIEIVVNTDPVRPSDAGHGSDGSPVARERSRLRGDLDAIVLKAMSKEPERRYGSAGEVADDLERFLGGQPVIAREPSVAYVLRKLAARNKTATSIAVAAMIAIVTALGIALWQRHIAIREHERAEQRFRDVRQLANALIFKIHDAVQPLDGSTPVRKTIVTEALAYLEKLERESGGDEALALELSGAYRQIGGILGDPGRPNLGDRTGALQQYERARNLVLPLVSRPHPTPQAILSLVNVDSLIASLLSQNGQRDRGIEMAREAYDQAQRLIGLALTNDRPRNIVARAAFMLALAHGSDPQAIPDWRRAGELYEAELADAPDDSVRQRNVALVEKYLAQLLEGSDLDEAERHYRRALSLDDRRYQENQRDRAARFDLAIDLANVATIEEKRDHLDDAFDLYSRSLSLRQSLVESDRHDVLARGRLGYVQMRLARLEIDRGHPQTAISLAEEAIKVQQEVSATTKDRKSQGELAMALLTAAEGHSAVHHAETACTLLERAQAIWATVPPAQPVVTEPVVARLQKACPAR
jgi:non-specific serine/threonine protein kinase/serine/threonine-protein kinase